MVPMPNENTTWSTVWAAVRARQKELGWTDTQLHEQCNISDSVYRDGRNDGRPLKRPDKIASLEDGLGWQRGSVDAILGGGEPVVAHQTGSNPPNVPSAVQHPVATVDADELLARIKAMQDEHERRIEALIGRLTEGENDEQPPRRRVDERQRGVD